MLPICRRDRGDADGLNRPPLTATTKGVPAWGFEIGYVGHRDHASPEGEPRLKVDDVLFDGDPCRLLSLRPQTDDELDTVGALWESWPLPLYDWRDPAGSSQRAAMLEATLKALEWRPGG